MGIGRPGVASEAPVPVHLDTIDHSFAERWLRHAKRRSEDLSYAPESRILTQRCIINVARS